MGDGGRSAFQGCVRVPIDLRVHWWAKRSETDIARPYYSERGIMRIYNTNISASSLSSRFLLPATAGAIEGPRPRNYDAVDGIDVHVVYVLPVAGKMWTRIDLVADDSEMRRTS